MKFIYMGLALGVLSFGAVGCATGKGSASRSASNGQTLLLNDEHAIATAEANYKDAVLKHGQTSDEAVKAKTAWDEAKNKYEADQAHVQQLQQINSNTSANTMPSNNGTSGTNTTTTTP